MFFFRTLWPFIFSLFRKKDIIRYGFHLNLMKPLVEVAIYNIDVMVGKTARIQCLCV